MILNIGTGETAPRFSIIMPTFNRGHIVARAIRSVIAQAFGDWELLVIDDGSKDETFAAIRDVVRSDTRIRYHFASNRGLAMARNLGIQMSRGEYLTFLDSDDEYTPEHLALRAQCVAEQASVALLHGGVEVIGQQFVADTFDPTKLVAIADCVVGGAFFVRRDLVERLGGFRDVAYGDDNDFYSRAEANGEVIAHVNHPTYRYHRTQGDSLCAIVERDGVAGRAAERRPEQGSRLGSSGSAYCVLPVGHPGVGTPFWLLHHQLHLLAELAADFAAGEVLGVHVDIGLAVAQEHLE